MNLFLPNKKRKTVGRSFRIDEEWLDVLKEESEKQGVSVNSILTGETRVQRLPETFC